MANKVSKSKSAVRAAREAVKASQKEVLERAARNAEDLAVFFSSRERLDAVDEWLEAKTAGLKKQAEGKRAEHRRTAGQAVVALRNRGQTLRDIAGLTGVSGKVLRELIRSAESTAPNDLGPDQATQTRRNPDDAGARSGGVAAVCSVMSPPVSPAIGVPDETWPASG
ncbi:MULTISPECIES: hypothetical protein [Mycolicibacterium]|uniref:Uncharacterized protein n=2 Tax=Mycolicibacterium TaxID=1866885 RepID=A0A255D6C1_9MYCO|nr:MULTISPECIES: hypothetical protein [Mycolicibacterium]MCV7174558.1 hypothetical protein [Mycolicibacterium sphagni]MCV7225168.1 hypothetical protein [Mycolicibacterium komossense]OYN74724.1 hypothetical protein CG716_27565 [Mycolicibacterium sphagni]